MLDSRNIDDFGGDYCVNLINNERFYFAKKQYEQAKMITSVVAHRY